MAEDTATSAGVNESADPLARYMAAEDARAEPQEAVRSTMAQRCYLGALGSVAPNDPLLEKESKKYVYACTYLMGTYHTCKTTPKHMQMHPPTYMSYTYLQGRCSHRH